ncbi:MAG: TIGR00725 family protein [Thermodesulfovibrionales bacterium]|nr:TIGR00725 family protein [Thermodesulfovibrionales bacterium]
MRRIIAVIGGRRTENALLKEAEEVGRLIAGNGAVLVCGGLGGVMEAASRGAKAEGGLTVGILPQNDAKAANQYIDIPITTGLGIGRNVVIARTADALIAVGGEYGTLSEIAFALQMGKPVIGIRTWDIKGVIPAENAGEAVAKAFELLKA